MKCPFPGMDPWLEGSGLWQGFHNRFLTYLADAIQPELPANYVATLEVRIYLEEPGPEMRRSVRLPDVEIVRTGPSVAVLERPTTATLVGYRLELEPIEVREAYLVIRDISAGELVTSIELLSPSNKQSADGHSAYQSKRNSLRRAGCNLVEIDLLRAGKHTVMAPEEDLAALSPFHYLASLYRRRDDTSVQVFTWSIRDGLPVLPIPLASGDDDVPLELQPVFDAAYERGSFWRLLNYREEPTPPLAVDDRNWANGLLVQAGLR